MKYPNQMKRILSFMLAIVMIFGMMPVFANAAESGREADTIFFATDRHQEASKLKSLLQALQYTPGLVVLGGDHVNDKNSGSLASITAEIQTVYPGVQTFYTYAAHDPNVSADSSNPYAYANTGEHYEGEDYYVYAVDQGDMQSASSASTASNAFVNWAKTADSSKVIFVMCHMPIHNRRGDNAGGATWMSALNEVGKTHDVVYLWGHNHTGENSADTSVYFVNMGGSLTPQGGSAGTINFTYMNAGYIKNGYASMVVVNDDAVNITRYNTSGSATANYTITRRFAETHTWQVTETVEATCVSDGYKTTVCTDCGETKTTVIPATGHTYSETVQDTCTGSFTVYTCTSCGHSYSEENPTETTYDKATGLVAGESYVIVASNYALTYGSSVGKTSVSVSNNSITSNVTDAMIWTYQNGMLYNEANSKYINVSSSSSSNRPGSSSSRTITFGTSGASASYSSSNLKLGNYYLYYSSNSGFSARNSGSTVTLYQVNEAFGGTGEHTYETVTVQPTCTEDGSITYTCTSCGHSYTETLFAAGHSYTAVITAPTCEAEGYTTYTCACGDSYVSDYVNALGHAYDSVVVEATCTEGGYTGKTCANCGDTVVTDETEALGHAYQSVTTEADCVNGGCTTHTCDRCGDSYITDEVPAHGHDYEFGFAVEPSCTEQGYTAYICNVCGNTELDNYLDPVGHSYETITVQLTCTEDGFHKHVCSDCGDTYYTDYVEAAGHQYSVTVENGYNVYTCQVCGDTYSDEVVVTYNRVNTITTGNVYVVSVYMNGQYYALSHADNTLSFVEIEKENSWITTEVTEDLLWNYTSARKLCYESNGKTYSLYASGNLKDLTLSTTQASTVTYSGTKLKIGSYYLRSYNGRIVASRTATTAYMFVEG